MQKHSPIYVCCAAQVTADEFKHTQTSGPVFGRQSSGETGHILLQWWCLEVSPQSQQVNPHITNDSHRSAAAERCNIDAMSLLNTK